MENQLLFCERPSVYTIVNATKNAKLITTFLPYPEIVPSSELESWTVGYLHGIGIYPDPHIVLGLVKGDVATASAVFRDEYESKLKSLHSNMLTLILGFNIIEVKNSKLDITPIKFKSTDDKNEKIKKLFKNDS